MRQEGLARGAAAAVATAGAAVAALAIVALVAVTVLDVGGRYFLNQPLVGAVELSEFLLVILCFAGFAWAERRNAHVGVDFFIERLPAGARRALDRLATLVGIAFWGCVGWRAALHTAQLHAAQETSHSLQIATWPFFLAVVVGSAMLVLLLAVRLVRGPFADAAAPAS